VSVLPVLLLLSLGFAGLAVGTFLWALRNGQFDDLDTPPHRVLWDEDSTETTRGNGP
jgi:cbb3-type cytochrome oxidase maturation protein